MPSFTLDPNAVVWTVADDEVVVVGVLTDESVLVLVLVFVLALVLVLVLFPLCVC